MDVARTHEIADLDERLQTEIDGLEASFDIADEAIQVAMYSDSGVQQAWTDICKVIKPMQAKVTIDKVFPFDRVQEAFEHMRHGPMGKVFVGPMA